MQKQLLLEFLKSETEASAISPLPILGDKTNRRRVDPEISIPVHHIFRDRWERKIEVDDYNDFLRRHRDVESAFDDSELDD